MQRTCTTDRYRCSSYDHERIRCLVPNHQNFHGRPQCQQKHFSKSTQVQLNPQSPQKTNRPPKMQAQRPRSGVPITNLGQSRRSFQGHYSHWLPQKQSKGAVLKQFYDKTNSKFNEAFSHLLGKNSKYMMERSAVCCKKKPYKHNFDLGAKPGYSTYTHDYRPKKADPVSPIRQIDNLQVPPDRFPQQTTNAFFHDPKDPTFIKGVPPPTTNKFDGPIKNYSTYMNHFPEWGNCQRDSIPCQQDFQPRGMNFNGNPIYKTSYKGQKGKPSDLARPKDYQFPDAKIPKQTTYNHHHNEKDKYPNRRFDQQRDFIPRPGVFGTEFQGEFTDPKDHFLGNINKCHKKYIQID